MNVNPVSSPNSPSQNAAPQQQMMIGDRISSTMIHAGVFDDRDIRPSWPACATSGHPPEGQVGMPFSDAQGKDAALDWYRQIAPATVVDIGAGSGTYAKLMQPAHEARWTAIEAWEPYAARFDLIDHYDEIRIADARDLGSLAFDVDLVIAGDVLEHMAYADARGLLARIKQTARNVIVSIPVLHLDQGDVFGNPFERHIDHWTTDAMRDELGDGVKAEWIGNVLGYFWWRKP